MGDAVCELRSPSGNMLQRFAAAVALCGLALVAVSLCGSGTEDETIHTEVMAGAMVGRHCKYNRNCASNFCCMKFKKLHEAKLAKAKKPAAPKPKPQVKPKPKPAAPKKAAAEKPKAKPQAKAKAKAPVKKVAPKPPPVKKKHHWTIHGENKAFTKQLSSIRSMTPAQTKAAYDKMMAGKEVEEAIVPEDSFN